MVWRENDEIAQVRKGGNVAASVLRYGCARYCEQDAFRAETIPVAESSGTKLKLPESVRT